MDAINGGKIITAACLALCIYQHGGLNNMRQACAHCLPAALFVDRMLPAPVWSCSAAVSEVALGHDTYNCSKPLSDL